MMATGIINNENVVESYTSSFPSGSLNKWAADRVGRITSIRAMDVSSQVATGTTMFTLPIEFAPAGTFKDFIVFDRTGTFLGTIRCDTDGNVYPVFDPLKVGSARCTFTFANHG